MKEKNILITGGNAGIGLATAIALAKKGANIYIVSRSKEKAEDALVQIKKESKNESIHYFLADLSSQKSIRKLAQQVNQKLTKLDVLINNAGGVFSEFQLSEDGIEMTIATNHFSFFLLTNSPRHELPADSCSHISLYVAAEVRSDLRIRGFFPLTSSSV